MRKAAHAAVTLSGFLKIKKRVRMRAAAAGFDSEIFKERTADQMRWPAAHGTDPDIDAGLAKKHRLKLSMGVGQMQDSDIAEAADVVKIFVGRQCGV